MTLKCWIGSGSLKCWGRIIHTLAAAGENDIHFNFTASFLTLSTVDSSLSICCTCKFDKSFFIRYEVVEGNQLFCRVPSKCLLKPFKSLRFLLRCSDACEIEFDPERNALIITLPCKGGVKVRHKLNFSVENEDLEVDYDTDALKNCIAADPKLMLRSLSNFGYNKGVADLTLKVLRNKLLLKNCINDMIKKEGKVYTELMMNPVDFAEYVIEAESELTFPMREFKSFVTFAEHMKTSLSLHFLGPNEPLLVKAESDDGMYTASLLLATTSLGHERARSSHVSKTRNVATASEKIDGTTQDTGPNVSTEAESSIARRSAWSGNTNIRVQTVQSKGNNPIRQDGLPPPAPDREPRDLHPRTPEPEDSALFDFPDDDPMEIENDQNVAPNGIIHDAAEDSDDSDEDRGRKRMRLLFPNLGHQFDPARDLPGYNEIIVECSDEEDS